MQSTQFGHLVIAVIAAISMVAVAYFEIGPENAWLYLIVAWSVLSAAFELYSGLRGRRGRPPTGAARETER